LIEWELVEKHGRKLKMKISKNKLKIVGLFTIILGVVFGSVAWFFLENLAIWTDKDIKYARDAEWTLLEQTLFNSLDKAKADGELLAHLALDRLGEDYLSDTEQVSYDLDNFYEPNNPIRLAIAETTENYYFDNIKSDSTDPFVTFGEGISADKSDDCATFGETRSFEEEYGMHANPDLAEEAFFRINIASVENYGKGARNKPIFFQFCTHPDGENIREDYGNGYAVHSEKRAYVLESYDLDGLKAKFYETNSWEEVFYAFEFITPTYIFYKSDLAGRPFVEYGRRTDAKRLAINIGFNFKAVIDNNPDIKSALVGYSKRADAVLRWHTGVETTLLLIIFLVLIVCSLCMFYVGHLTKEE